MDKIKSFTENHEENTLLYILVAFMLGVLIGLIASPAKNGITLFSNNGCDNNIKDNGSCNSSDSSKRIEKK
ncbi:MAG: hypothetical protein LKG21_02510 [Ruminococcus sp.]|jgi:hypothetical protein|nr:hypothetical protein [Ruminococcus sp.]